MARLPSWGLRALAWGLLVAATAVAAAAASDTWTSDLIIYRDFAVAALSGSWPGWHSPAVYPVGLVLLALPLAPTTDATLTATWVFVVILPVTLLMLLALALARVPAAPARPGWRGVRADTRLHAGLVVAACTVALEDWWVRYEPVVALAALLGLVAAREGRPLFAGGWLAVGFWLKGWPLVLALPAARAAGSRVLVAAAAGIGVVAAAAALLRGDHVWSFVTANDNRAPQPEALATLPAMLLRGLGVDGWSVHFDRGIWAYVVTGPGVRAAATAITVIVGLLAVAVSIGYLRHRRHGPAGWGDAEACVSVALVGLVVLASPVFSPQYMAWLVPVVAVAVLDGRQRVGAVLLVVACVLTSIVHPHTYDALVAGQLGPVLLLLARDVLLVALVAGAARPLLRPGPRSDAPTAAAPSAQR